jgi:hypothetical protein
MPIAETIAGLKVLSQGLKSLGEIGETINNAKVKELTSEMLDKVIPLKHDLLALELENAELKSQVKILNEKLADKGQWTWERDTWWKIQGDKKEGPYCPNCKTEGKESHLIHYSLPDFRTNHNCPHCNRDFTIN